ncbi:hypothetical protein [Tenacibaculum finnmarkense]|uniref:hypothetical protein n=1 Tax=Tenacibaculum finnmarkense TaxID=2781243 RepID=UPI000C4004DB|nr:hypothetical protein [Tenacibaculum finnmarkense]MBE7660706.1 hypothetical protein [Tenacibaculum finnmarkense genomovar finnmarkense]MCG8252973.1 hypothetical protein [Tenacibaculum finnmarkense genomovar finnmarkense]MCG8732200.1 hypothetical protein [Tenacibaculum finnmarkense]MCG8752817.1 hypothetical protein [Tenacibaculum finnmarkense]MCG8773701.1 hypothetical protein [Tenacibaculum finnmarkense]
MKNKIQVITGKQGTGKTFLAKNMAMKFDNVVLLDGRSEISLSSMGATNKETDLIIIDNVGSEHLYNLVFLLSKKYLIINRLMASALKIKTPSVFILSDNEIGFSKMGTSIKRRCSFIETSVEIDTNGDKLFNTKKLC